MELLDGATGVWLARHSSPEGTASAAVREPARLRSLAEAYATAGARLLRSPTFSIPAALANGVRPESALAWLRSGYDLVNGVARSRGVSAAWSLGPTGLGSHGREQASEIFCEVAAETRSHAPNVDVFLESFTSAAEARLAVSAFADAGLATHTWLLLVPSVEGTLADSTPIATLAREFHGQIAGLGIGCVGPEVDAAKLLEQLGAAGTPSQVLAPPCFGDAVRWASEFAATVSRTPLASRPRWIGGCCGTGPGHIAALRAALGEAGVSIDHEPCG